MEEFPPPREIKRRRNFCLSFSLNVDCQCTWSCINPSRTAIVQLKSVLPRIPALELLHPPFRYLSVSWHCMYRQWFSQQAGISHAHACLRGISVTLYFSFFPLGWGRCQWNWTSTKVMFTIYWLWSDQLSKQAEQCWTFLPNNWSWQSWLSHMIGPTASILWLLLLGSGAFSAAPLSIKTGVSAGWNLEGNSPSK